MRTYKNKLLKMLIYIKSLKSYLTRIFTKTIMMMASFMKIRMLTNQIHLRRLVKGSNLTQSTRESKLREMMSRENHKVSEQRALHSIIREKSKDSLKESIKIEKLRLMC